MTIQRKKLASTWTTKNLTEKLQIIAFFVFLIVLVLGGGSSRNDAAPQTWIWITGVVAICASLSDFTRADYTKVRVPLLFSFACAGLMLLQLVPLPPSLWMSLPSRSIYADIGMLAGIGQPWRPLSITPHATLASLLSMTVPFAIILAFVKLEHKWQSRALPIVVILALLSAVLALAQLGSGSGGPLRFYAVTNLDYAVGFFANRNHQALFLASALTLAAAAGKFFVRDAASPLRTWLTISTWMFLIPMILLTGSRVGVLLAVPAVAIGILILIRPIKGEFIRRKHKASPAMKWAPTVAVLFVVGASLVLSRSVAIDRLFATDPQGELRTRLWPSLVDTAIAFFPTGSGFGSFDPVYRRFEPFELLNPSYLNMAHNDAIQLVIEGGLPALALLATFLIWFVATTRTAWRTTNGINANLLMARCGSAVIAFSLFASIADYPLRTPLFAGLFTAASLWLHFWHRP